MRTHNTAVCVYHASGKTHRRYLHYKTPEDLAYKVFHFEVDFDYQPNIFLVHDVANGLVLRWNSALADHCFAKGNITETELINLMKSPIEGQRKTLEN